MSPAVRGFLRSAVLWLGLGLALGLWLALAPARTPQVRPAHLHALLAGFVLFMIFGVGYHVLPRFGGRPIPWPRGPMMHLVLANVGVALLVTGFLLRGAWPSGSRLIVPMGGGLVLAGALIFIHAVWRLTERPKWEIQDGRPSSPPPSPKK